MTETKLLTTPSEGVGSRLSPGALHIPSELPILPLSDVVVFPHMIVPLVASSAQAIRLIDDVVAGDRFIGVVLQKDLEQENPRFEHLHEYGCVARVSRMLKFPDESTRVLIQGVKRMKIVRMIGEKPYFIAQVETLEEKIENGIELTALARNAASQFQEIIRLTPSMPEDFRAAALSVEDPARLADVIAASLNLTLEEKQRLLETADVRARLGQLVTLLGREREVLHLDSEIKSRVTKSITKSQREYFLREQLKTIQKELDEGAEADPEIRELRDKIDKAKMPVEAKKVAIKEVQRLATVPSAAAEYTVIRTYLDWLIAMPWAKGTEDKLDIARARRILDEDHYDLEQVKKRILEYLSVLKLKGNSDGEVGVSKGPILCFVGPPGVVKTSLGMSIARALGLKFVRISLGGIRDEAEIRGHRRTYVGDRKSVV